jgi:hypothetical protein
MLYKGYMDTKVVIIKYLWVYGLLFGIQQAIFNGSNNLNCGFENLILLKLEGRNIDMFVCMF